MSSVPTELFSGSEIEYVRVILGQAGRLNQIVEDNEPQIAISDSKIYTNFKDITDVIGIWDANDYYHSGTNYALSGTFDSKKGIIYTATSGTLTFGGSYLVSYVHGDGVNDRDIQRCLDDADAQLSLLLYVREPINYDTSTTIGKIAYATKINLAALHALSIMNTGNILQSGFNYALGELRIETKLWGEGMSTESLVANFEKKINSMIEMLKLYYHEGMSVIQVYNRNNGATPYGKNRLKKMINGRSLSDWVQDGITLSRQFKIVEEY